MKITIKNDKFCFFLLMCLFVSCTIISYFLFSCFSIYTVASFFFLYPYVSLRSHTCFELMYISEKHKKKFLNCRYSAIRVRTHANQYCVLLLVCFVFFFSLSFFYMSHIRAKNLYTPRVYLWLISFYISKKL
jgi:hypothetical protein